MDENEYLPDLKNDENLIEEDVTIIEKDLTTNSASADLICNVLIGVKYNSSSKNLKFYANVDSPLGIFYWPTINSLSVKIETADTKNGTYTSATSKTWTNCNYITDYYLPDLTAQTKYYKFTVDMYVDNKYVPMIGENSHTWLINRTGHLWDSSWEYVDELSSKKVTSPPANYTAGVVASHSYDYKAFYIKEYKSRYGVDLDLKGGKFEVHHIKPLKYGGDHSFDNLIHMPKAAHTKITSWFAGY